MQNRQQQSRIKTDKNPKHKKLLSIHFKSDDLIGRNFFIMITMPNSKCRKIFLDYKKKAKKRISSIRQFPGCWALNYANDLIKIWVTKMLEDEDSWIYFSCVVVVVIAFGFVCYIQTEPTFPVASKGDGLISIINMHIA